jgi:hypothetical protein
VTRLSSRAIWFYKWIYPVLWFGFLASAVLALSSNPDGNPMFAAVPVLLIVGGLGLFWLSIWRCADLVEDEGDFLRVRRGRRVAEVPLHDIDDVYRSGFGPTYPVTLRLSTPGPFGTAIHFMPAGSELVDELSTRVHRARNSPRLYGPGDKIR